MTHRGMSKLRKVEKAGLIVLCVVMLGTLGLGSQATCDGGSGGTVALRMNVDGEEIEMEGSDYRRYSALPTLQQYIMRRPPVWKFLSPRDPAWANYEVGPDDTRTFVILDQVAQRAGIEVPAAAMSDWVAELLIMFGGKTYEEFLGIFNRVWPTATEFEDTLRSYLRVKYFVNMHESLLRPPSQTVFDRWKSRNTRYNAKYVVQDFAPLRAAIDPESFSREELDTYFEDDLVRGKFEIPDRRSFEAVYLRPSMMDEAALTRIADLAAEQKITVTSEEALAFYREHDYEYPLGPIRDRIRAQEEKRRLEKEGEEKDGDSVDADSGERDADKPVDDEGGDDSDKDESNQDDPEAVPEDGEPEKPGGEEEPTAPGAEDGAPAVGEDGPAIDPPAPDIDLRVPDAAEEERVPDPAELSIEDRFEKYFRLEVQRDLLIRKVLDRILNDERANKKGMAKIKETYGLGYFKTEELLDEAEVRDLPELGGNGLARAFGRFGADRVGEYDTRLFTSTRPDGKAIGFIRVTNVIPKHFPDFGHLVTRRMIADIGAAAGVELSSGDVEEMPVRGLLKKVFSDATIDGRDEWTVEAVVRLMYRTASASREGRKILESLKDKVMGGGQTLPAAAEEQGLTVRELAGISEETVPLPEINAAEGGELTSEQLAENRLRAYRRYLLGRGGALFPGNSENVHHIRRTESGRFVPDVFVDRDSDAAYVVYVDGQESPSEDEMPRIAELGVRQEHIRQDLRPQLRLYFDLESLEQRYGAEFPGRE